MDLYPVIMAGGSGTRFWPLSRRRRPKQLLPLVSDKALIAETVARLPPLAGMDRTLVVCGRAHASAVRRLLPDLLPGRLLVEPVARNTAPCVGLAAAVIARENPKGILAVLPSDHHVGDVPAFREALRQGAEIARDGALVTLGIKPSRPETGYGYVQLGEPWASNARAHRVKAFVEKPDAARARSYLDGGQHLWNAGIFLFRADAILEEIRRHMPALSAGLERLSPAIGTRGFGRALARVFPELPAISIDYGVMERAANIAVLPADFGWSDVGSFAALPEVRKLDGDGNVTQGLAVPVGSKRCVVIARDRPVAVVGMEDVVVVDAGDAILVCSKERAQEVRKVVEELERRGEGRFL